MPATEVKRAAFSVNETCEMLGISRPTLYKLINEGRLRTAMAGSKRLITAASIADFLASA